MRLFSIVFISLTIFSINTQADDTNTWIEFSAGAGNDLLGTSVNIKYGNENSNWAIELGEYSKLELLSHTENRKGKSVNIKMTTLAFTKNWNKVFNWGYKEAGIGLGVVDGTWADNCTSKNDSNSFGGYDVCNITDGIRFGIPVHGSLVFGKYFGIGITAKAFLTTEHAHAGINITIPLGDFTN